MAEFEAKVYRLTIEEHPNADAIELAIVGDYRSIVRKGQFKTGDLGVYIPCGTVVPEWIVKSLGLWDHEKNKGKLAGPSGTRLKEARFRGVLSEGLVYPVDPGEDDFGPFITVGSEDGVGTMLQVEEGDDVTRDLGLVKYEPPIPVHMAGEVANAFGYTLAYDIENYKKFPDVLVEGEEVVMTEKIHGTFVCFAYHPEYKASRIITSKGLSESGLVFKINERNQDNLYIRALNRTAPYPDGTGGNVLDRATEFNLGDGGPFYILGEVFGDGVQDLRYGATVPQFRVFDIYVGSPGEGEYVSYDKMIAWCTLLDVEPVPILYRGPFSKEVMLEHSVGRESVSGKEANLREGLVIRPVVERRDVELGRVVLKSISEKYLTRKNKNATEYQ